jgi:hypothetical protein
VDPDQLSLVLPRGEAAAQCVSTRRGPLDSQAAPAMWRSARMMAGGLSPEDPTVLRVLLYTYVPDILEKRGPHRAGHLAAAKAQEDAGK